MVRIPNCIPDDIDRSPARPVEYDLPTGHPNRRIDPAQTLGNYAGRSLEGSFLYQNPGLGRTALEVLVWAPLVGVLVAGANRLRGGAPLISYGYQQGLDSALQLVRTASREAAWATYQLACAAATIGALQALHHSP